MKKINFLLMCCCIFAFLGCLSKDNAVVTDHDLETARQAWSRFRELELNPTGAYSAGVVTYLLPAEVETLVVLPRERLEGVLSALRAEDANTWMFVSVVRELSQEKHEIVLIPTNPLLRSFRVKVRSDNP